MGRKRSDIVAAFKASLLDAAALFGTGDDQTAAFDRHLDEAIADFSRARPLVNSATLTLQHCVADYPAPDDAIRFQTCEMIDRNGQREPYNNDSVTQVPTPVLVRIAGAKSWRFRPVPTNYVIGRLGSTYDYEYVARHQLVDAGDGTATTLESQDIPLLILRAQAAAMREAAIRNMSKPVGLRDGMYSQTRNGTPAALADQLMKMFDAMTRPDAEPYR